MMEKKRSVYEVSEFDRDRLETLWALIDEMKRHAFRYQTTFKDKIVATLFYEPSTRTRLSFESAVIKLGGNVISTENAKEFSSAIKGETLLDTLRVVEGYADAIVIRHSDDLWPDDVKDKITVPIINGGSGKKEHPTQSLLDLYTLYDEKGNIDNLKICIVGDLFYGRTVHSLLGLIANYSNITVYGLSPKELELQQEYIDAFEAKGHKYIKCSGFQDLPADLDVFYSTRVQLERMEGVATNPFILNKAVMEAFPNAIILHPLPRNDEISTDLDDDPRALYFKQAHNGVYTRMAILYQAVC